MFPYNWEIKLFVTSIYLFVILFFVRDLLPHGVELDYRLDGRLFKLSRLKAKTKVMKTAVINLQYGDDILAHSAEELQTSLDLFTEAYPKSRTFHQHQKSQGYPSTYSRHQCRTSRNQSIWRNHKSCRTLPVLRESPDPESHYRGRNSATYLMCQYVIQETAPPSL